MSKLDSLIRLHERTLDEARRELSRAEAAVASADAAIDALEAEIKAEQAAAGADLTGQFGYANYARQAIARRAELHAAHQQAEVAREQVREKAAVAFAELKKFEITANGARPWLNKKKIAVCKANWTKSPSSRTARKRRAAPSASAESRRPEFGRQPQPRCSDGGSSTGSGRGWRRPLCGRGGLRRPTLG